MNATALFIRVMGSRRIRKIRLNSWLLRLVAFFIDYESEHLPPGSRIVEYPFVLCKLMHSPKGTALDVGCIALHNYASPMLAFAGWDMYGIDIRSEWQFHHPNFHFVQEDICSSTLETGKFDVVLCISTLEHIGLTGYYGNTKEDVDGDKAAMQEITRVTKTGGRLLLTVPFSRTYSRRPGVRVYDANRLDELLTGFAVNDEIVYGQTKDGHWEQATRELDEEGVICLAATRK